MLVQSLRNPKSLAQSTHVLGYATVELSRLPGGCAAKHLEVQRCLGRQCQHSVQMRSPAASLKQMHCDVQWHGLNGTERK